ncbi:MAG: SYNERG-CTERM sorting domain-containing protein, partial [Synergistaceae bacterium]|nr:SYNERG-CTERM sorting domain-containing protein [Synergistaceae bacterium]
KSAMKALLLTVEEGGGPAAPEGLVATPPTAQGMTDGTISGVDAGMEWSADGGETWTGCPEQGTIEGLAPGDYLVRYKATEAAGPGDAATVTVPESGAHVVTVRLIDGGDGGPVVVLELTSDGGPVAGMDLWAWLVPTGGGAEQGAFLGTTDIEGRLILDVDDLTLVTGGKAVIPAGTWRIRIEIRDADGELWTGVSSDTVSLPATSTRSGGGCFNVGFGGLAMMALAGVATRRRR